MGKRVKLHNIDVEALKDIGVKEAEKRAKRVVERAKLISEHSAPIDKGNLRDMHIIKKTKDSFILENYAPYAKYVHAMPQSMIKDSDSYAQWMWRAMKMALDAESRGKL